MEKPFQWRAENAGKLQAAKEHFSVLNTIQKKKEYLFFFLSPGNYERFFRAPESDSLNSFVPDLRVQPEEFGDN